ncbi:MAG: GntR family transcriptional regulator [Ardenticatenaceae bacterium]|nr:GntR family transcriptional regulator [Ardenticatenaceae bacterium]
MTSKSHTLNQNRTIHLVVANHLRQAIINGQLKPGQKLIQDEIAAEYGISRMPVREAFRTLAAEGYVTIYPHRGVIVTELSTAEIEEIFSIRILLEGWATRLAASSITADSLARLNDLISEMEISQATPARYHLLNTAFHDTIFKAAQQPRLRALVMNLRNVVEPYLRIYLSGEGRIQRAHSVHKALCEALAARDAEKAEQLAKDHLRQALDALLSNLPHVAELPDADFE